MVRDDLNDTTVDDLIPAEIMMSIGMSWEAAIVMSRVVFGDFGRTLLPCSDDRFNLREVLQSGDSLLHQDKAIRSPGKGEGESAGRVDQPTCHTEPVKAKSL